MDIGHRNKNAGAVGGDGRLPLASVQRQMGSPDHLRATIDAARELSNYTNDYL
jgi:hypothetical protein